MRIPNVRVLSFLASIAPLAAGAQSRKPAALPCDALSAAEFSAVVGYSVTAKADDNVCTYSGPTKADGGQLKYLALFNNANAATASAKRMQGKIPGVGSLGQLSAIDSEGTLVFTVAFNRHEPDANTAAQLAKLVAAAKQHLAKAQ